MNNFNDEIKLLFFNAINLICILLTLFWTNDFNVFYACVAVNEYFCMVKYLNPLNGSRKSIPCNETINIL